MLLTGEVCRAAKATVVACKQRELQQAIQIQLPATVPAQHPVHFTRRQLHALRGKEGVMSRKRKLVSA